MSNEKIYLGKHVTNGSTWLTKHKWDCGWYWGFGYIGNRDMHWHIESIIKHPSGHNPNWTDVGTHFSTTWITQNQWWILRDLFISAYGLKEAAAIYRYGGHQTSHPYGVINPEMAKLINVDLGKTLDTIWDLVNKWSVESSEAARVVRIEARLMQGQKSG